MCTPQASIGLQISGALSEATGAYLKTSGERSNLEASANMADLNARLSDMSAKQALRQGQVEYQASRLDTANLKEKQRTSFAANGIDLSSDTAVRVLTSTDVLGEIDANTINANAARAAWGYKLEGVQYRNEALVTRAGAKNLNPLRSARSSLINSAGDIAASWYKLKKAGAFDDNRGTGKPYA